MRILLTVVSCAALVLTGCAAGQKTIGSYQGASPSAGHGSGHPAAPAGRSAGVSSDQAAFARDVLMPVLIRVNDRITAYEHNEKAWQEIMDRPSVSVIPAEQPEQFSRCSKQASDLLAGYTKLHDKLLKDQPAVQSRRLIRTTYFDLEKKDIAYLEGECPQLLSGFTPSAVRYLASGTESLEKSMESALAKGQYEQVIHDYQSQAAGLGENTGYGVSYIYALALIKSGRVQEARRVLSDQLTLLRSRKQGQAEFTLVRLLADLDFGTGDYMVARSRYEEFQQLYERLGEQNDWAGRQLAILEGEDLHSNEVRTYAALLLGYLAYNPERDGFTVVQQAQAFQQKYPMSMFSSNATEIGRKAATEAEKWFAGLLEQVDLLSAEQKNQEALLLIERVPADILPLDKQAILKLKKRSLVVSMQPVRDTGSDTIVEEILETTYSDRFAVDPDTAFDVLPDEHVPVTALDEIWDQGMASMQAKEYDQAIESFSGLLNTSYGTKAQLQIEEAARLAAQDVRKKAAELFVRANRTTDIKTRKQLLLSSKTLLEEILQKYPQAGLEDKVKRNLERINRELVDLEPAVVPSSVQDVNGPVTPQPSYQIH